MQLDVQVLGEVAREAPVFREDVTNGREHGHAAMPLRSAMTQHPKPKGRMLKEEANKEASWKSLINVSLHEAWVPQGPVGANQEAEISGKMMSMALVPNWLALHPAP